ncbi:hypothetical protein OpiT1DRAFT_00517 [Opitutaceae bacterium TAV1]|nr:hypothetical protein OpiT1DRAFT_00517 [Opitutaceae bacterium TAV1]
MDLSAVRGQVMAYLETLRVPGAPYGCYRYRPGATTEQDLYATTDVAILRTVMGEDLRTSLTPEQRQQWIGHINSFAREDGVYGPGGHSDHHRNGMVIGALGPLGGRQKFPVRFYRDFDTPETAAAWLEKIDWSRQWPASHLFWGGMHCHSLSRHCTAAWREAVFCWLDTHLDPQTGWWRRGVDHADRDQPLGGGAHIWPIYQHHGRRFPYPERVIDSILAMQRRDGSWLRFGHYLDLDALYGLAWMGSLAPGYRSSDVAEAVRLHGDLALRDHAAFMKRGPDTHSLLAMAGGLGLLQQLMPGRFYDDSGVRWTDIFSDIRFYDTASVECG